MSLKAGVRYRSIMYALILGHAHAETQCSRLFSALCEIIPDRLDLKKEGVYCATRELIPVVFVQCALPLC